MGSSHSHITPRGSNLKHVCGESCAKPGSPSLIGFYLFTKFDPTRPSIIIETASQVMHFKNKIIVSLDPVRPVQAKQASLRITICLMRHCLYWQLSPPHQSHLQTTPHSHTSPPVPHFEIFSVNLFIWLVIPECDGWWYGSTWWILADSRQAGSSVLLWALSSKWFASPDTRSVGSNQNIFISSVTSLSSQKAHLLCWSLLYPRESRSHLSQLLVIKSLVCGFRQLR